MATLNATRPSATGTWTDAAHRVLTERYLAPGESPEDMCWRVAKKIATAERAYGATAEAEREVAEAFYDLMVRRVFLPNSPTLMNAGKDNGLQYSACFVLPVGDSMEEIFDAVKAAAIIHKSGGGTGFSFSRLRPKGALVGSTGGLASGPVSFLKVFNGATEAVKQGGTRRGANMSVLRVDHPDILEFIDCKRDGGITNFNISVGITDAFMTALGARTFYTLVDPRGGEVRQLDAVDVWSRIVKAAWATGDPGLVFLDRVNQSPANPLPDLLTIESTNPCFTGDTLVWTLEGPQRFDALVGREIPVLTQGDDGLLRYSMMRGITQTRASAPVYRVTVEARRGRQGRRRTVGSFTATGDHVVFRRDGTKAMVAQLQPGDRLGSVYRVQANQNYFGLNNGHEGVLEHWVNVTWAVGRRPAYPAEHVDHINGVKRDNRPDNLRILPASVHNALGMRGAENPSVRFPEKNPFLQPGFAAGERNGMWGRRHSDSTRRKIGDKTLERRARRAMVNHRVVSVEYVGEQPVYDGTVDDTHRFFVVTEQDGGVLVHNCGEQALPPWDACNLGSIVVSRFVNADKRIDLPGLARTVRLAVRFMDDVIDVNTFPLPQVEEAVKGSRRIGLGVMGWADLLFLVDLPYASEDAVKVGQELMAFIHETAVDQSRALALERGPFPLWNQSIYRQEAPRRNATVTSIAPTGTISLIAGCSSGIEPVFALAFQHRVKHPDGERVLDVINQTFEDVLAARGLLTEGVRAWVAQHGSVQGMPELAPSTANVFKTAHEIDFVWHIRHQAAYQLATDNGVSKTINLPADATLTDVEAAYQLAWDAGCRGITVFRDGCKGEQVLNAPAPLMKGLPEVVLPPAARPRPAVLTGVTHRVTTPVGVAYVTLNQTDTGEPFEAFIQVGKAGSETMAVSEALGRMISLILRLPSSIPPTARLALVADQLSGIGGNGSIGFGVERVRSLPDGIARVLRAPDVVMASGPERDLCKECGQAAVIWAEGCRKCEWCGFSEC